MRGILTNEIQGKATTFLGRDISQAELRLYPYIDYSIKNGCQGWEFAKLHLEELKILDKLQEEGHLVYTSSKVIVSRKFYDYMQEVLANSYVDEFL